MLAVSVSVETSPQSLLSPNSSSAEEMIIRIKRSTAAVKCSPLNSPQSVRDNEEVTVRR